MEKNNTHTKQCERTSWRKGLEMWKDSASEWKAGISDKSSLRKDPKMEASLPHAGKNEVQRIKQVQLASLTAWSDSGS